MTPEFAREKASSVFQVKSMGFPVSKTLNKRFFTAQIMLRAFSAVSTLAAICVMVTTSQSIILLGFQIKAHYSYSSAMRFLLVTDSIVCAFSAFSVIFVYRLSVLESNPKTSFYLFVHDVSIMVLAISGCAAATTVGYISKYGEEKMGWMAICNRVGKFCNQMTVSMVLSYLAFFTYFALVIMSGNKVMIEGNE